MVIPIQKRTIPIALFSLITNLDGSIDPESVARMIKSKPVAMKVSKPNASKREPVIAVAKMIIGRSNRFSRSAPVIANAPKPTGRTQTGISELIVDESALNKASPKLTPPKAPTPNKIHLHKQPDNAAPIVPDKAVPAKMILSKLPSKL